MKTIIKGAIALVILIWVAWMGFKWTVMRHYVGPNEVLVVISKFGKTLPPERITVPAGETGYKGIEEEVLGPGRYFINPVTHDTEEAAMTRISAGDPARWVWDSNGNLMDPSSAPQIGLVTLKEGLPPPAGQEVVDAGFKGLQKEILTPGTYKLNPHRFDVKQSPAWIVPPGSVGVVTKLVDDDIPVVSQRLSQAPATRPAPGTVAVDPQARGVLDEVLQPGVYYVNSRMARLTIIPVGFDAITLDHSAVRQVSRQPGAQNTQNVQTGISFYSNDGYLIEADFTVVWGRAPADAPNIVRNIGTLDKVEGNVIVPAMKAACQNEGAKYTAKQLIQGTTREAFQKDLSDSLERQVSGRSVHVLLAMIRNITIKDNTGKDQTDGLIATIQRANIEIERDITNKQKTQTATVKAQLEQALKLVDVARETIAAESDLKVAQILADGKKKAAEIDADRDLQMATINLQVAQLDAKRTEILGKADADVVRLKNEAEAQGVKLLVGALGSPAAYNKYIFAKNFEPKDLRLIFAGPGTFWTDLKNFQDIGASQVIQGMQEPKK